MAQLKVTVTLDDRGLKSVRRALRHGHPAITKGLTAAGYLIFKFWTLRYDRAPWPGLKPSTIEKKEFYGYGGKGVLKATEQLYNAINYQIRGFNVPGRNFTVTKKSVTVGYSNRGQYKPENAYTRSIGTIGRLADIQQTGAYRGGTPRLIIADMDQQTIKSVQNVLQKAINKVADEGNNAS